MREIKSVVILKSILILVLICLAFLGLINGAITTLFLLVVLLNEGLNIRFGAYHK